jgi:hypothetical protein
MVLLGLLMLSFALYPTSYPTVLITSHPTLLSFLLLGGSPHSVPVPSCTPTGFSQENPTLPSWGPGFDSRPMHQLLGVASS